MKNSKRTYKKRTYKKRNTKKSSSKKRLSKRESSSNKIVTESSSNESILKDKSLGEKIIIGLCVCILIVFPFIFIVFSISFAIYIGVSEKIDEIEQRVEKRESNEELYGKYLYLYEIDKDVYKVVSENEDPKRRLEWDEEFCGYYDDFSDGYVWYDVKRKTWKYWFNGISTDYKDYGWMVYNSDGWRIQKDDADWIKLPEKYDRSRLWYIKQE